MFIENIIATAITNDIKAVKYLYLRHRNMNNKE